MARKDDLTPENLPKQVEPQKPDNDEAQQPEFSMTEEEAQRAMEFLREEQNLIMGAVAGFIAAVSGALIWAVITVTTDYQSGWMAVGIGFLVGMAVRTAGKGIDQVFGVIGAVMALVGCALGNIFTFAYFLSMQTGSPLMEVLNQLDVEMVAEFMLTTFQVTDILFYGLALYFGYRYAFRQLTMDDFNRALGRAM